MPVKLQTRNVPALSLRAAVQPDTLNEEKRTIDVVWTTGARVMRGFFETYYEELSLDPKHVRMERLNGGAPLLDSHDGYRLSSVVGVVETARLEKGQGVATVRFARAEDDPEADAIFRKVKDGVIRNVSVGYRVHRLEKVEDGDETIAVYRATDWEPYEISMVPMGADAGAGVRSESRETNPCEFVIGERQERSTMAKKAKKSTTAAPTPVPAVRATEGDDDAEKDDSDDEAEEAEAEDVADEGDDDAASTEEASTGERAAGATAERARIVAIHRWAGALGVDARFVQRHVELGTSAAKFSRLAMNKREKDKPGIVPDASRVTAVRGGDSRDKWMRGAQDWLFQRSGTDRIIADYAKKIGEPRRIDPGEFRGMSMIDLARQSLERMGVRTAGMAKPQLIAMALTHRAGGYHTTSDFPILLEAATNQVLLAAYTIAPDTWRMFAKKGSVADFRPHFRVRQGSFGRLDKVNEHGEFKNLPITDGLAESIAAETRGNIVGITRQALINDDLGALSSMAAPLGRAAKLSIEIAVYELLGLNGGLGPIMSDGLTLFHADHDNIGVDSLLSVEGLGADMVLMAQQMDQSGNEFLDIRPSVLLVPLTLELKAIGMVAAEFDVDAADGVTPNSIRNLFPTIVGSPRISGTRRYVFADPNTIPTIEVVFLDGNETPYLETQDGWRIDGVEWKVRLDVGAGAVDFRGAATNDGTP